LAASKHVPGVALTLLITIILVIACGGLAHASPAASVEYKIGEELLSKQDYKGAIAAADKALSLDPNFVFAYGLRGAAFIALGQYQKCVDDCSKAIRLDPKYAHAYSLRGRAHGKVPDSACRRHESHRPRP
jgi:tetratricopeptide (TPR) repeat protein